MPEEASGEHVMDRTPLAVVNLRVTTVGLPVYSFADREEVPWDVPGAVAVGVVECDTALGLAVRELSIRRVAGWGPTDHTDRTPGVVCGASFAFGWSVGHLTRWLRCDGIVSSEFGGLNALSREIWAINLWPSRGGPTVGLWATLCQPSAPSGDRRVEQIGDNHFDRIGRWFLFSGT